MAAPIYQVFVKDPDTTEIWEMQFNSFNVAEELNKESVATFDISFESFEKIVDQVGSTVIDALSGAYREVWIERNGTKIFWGVLSDLSVSPGQQGDSKVQLKAVSWFGLLGKRITTPPVVTYTADDAGAIAWDLINDSQNSDSPYSELGITMGSITASKDRDRTYRFDNIKDSIIALSNNNLLEGFDFEIDNNKDFNVYYPTKGSNKFNIVFDTFSLASYSYRKPLLLSLVNKIHVLGSGDNDDLLYVTRNAANGYKTSWTLLEETLQERDIIETATLNDKGDRRLLLGREPTIEFEAQHYDDAIEWSDYALGDSVKVNLPRINLSNTTKRVVKRQITLSADKGLGYISSTLK